MQYGLSKNLNKKKKKMDLHKLGRNHTHIIHKNKEMK